MSSISLSIPVIHGSVSIISRDIAYVGKDISYDFKNKIFLQNGEPLSINPRDLIFQVRVAEEGKSNGEERYIHLPSSLFDQARVSTDKGDAILCRIEDKVYQLLLAPTRHSNRPEWEESFDGMMRALQNITKSTIPEYLIKIPEYPALDDVPDDIQFLYRHRNFYSLSPEVKRIYLDQEGAVPFDFKELKLADISTYVHDMDMWTRSHDENGMTFTLLAYSNCESGLEPYFEILLDGHRLFVTKTVMVSTEEEQHMDAVRSPVPPDLLKVVVSTEEVPIAEKASIPSPATVIVDCPYEQHSFFSMVIQSGLREIDPDKITVTFKEGYQLIFNIPYKAIASFDEQQPASKEEKTSPVARTMSGVCSNEGAIVPDKKIPAATIPACVNFNTGFGYSLGIRVDPNWEAPIPFEYGEGNNWKGEVPVERDFKFVIEPSEEKARRGETARWEKREKNRFLKQGDQDRLTLTSQDVRF